MPMFRNAAFCLALLVPVVLLGFWPKYLDVIGSVRLSLHIHFATMSLWVLVLIVQAGLIRGHRGGLHRTIGRVAGFGLGPVLIWSGLVVCHEMLRRGPIEISPRDLGAFALSVGALLPFIVTWALALVYRKVPRLHARFMISTGIAIIGAGLARALKFWMPGFESTSAACHGNFIVLELVSLALVAADWRAGMRRSPFLVILALMLFAHLLWVTSDSALWRSFSEVYYNLPAMAPWDA